MEIPGQKPENGPCFFIALDRKVRDCFADTLPNSGDTVADTFKALEEHLIPKINVVVERHTFRKRVQGMDETVLQYIAAIRDMATTCEFWRNFR